MKQGRSLESLKMEIERQSRSKQDFLLSPSNLEVAVREPYMDLTIKDKDIRLGMNNTFHSQVAEYYEIPMKYYDKMFNKHKTLLSSNLNYWFHRNGTRRRLRALDGNARAYLSDKYRPIDNDIVFELSEPILTETGANIVSCEITDRKMYIKATFPERKAEVVGDVITAGIVISNSEIGNGSVKVLPYTVKLSCLNGMVHNNIGKRTYHINRYGQDFSEDIKIFSAETMQINDIVFIMKLRDTIRYCMSEDIFSEITNSMIGASKIPLAEEGNFATVIEKNNKNYKLLKDESKMVLDHFIAKQDLSVFGYANAVTRTAEDVDSYDRATELETIGWNILLDNVRLN